MPDSAAVVTLEGVTVVYGRNPALRDVSAAGPINALKQPRGRVYELRVKTPGGELAPFVARLHAAGLDCHQTDEDVMRVFVPGDGGARQLFALASAEHVQVRHLRPSVATLEDVFAHAVGED